MHFVWCPVSRHKLNKFHMCYCPPNPNQDTDMFLSSLSRAVWGVRQFEMYLSHLSWDLQHNASGNTVCEQVSAAVSKGKTCSQVLHRVAKPVGISAPVTTTSWLWQFLPKSILWLWESKLYGILSNKDIYLAYTQFGFWSLFPIRSLSMFPLIVHLL